MSLLDEAVERNPNPRAFNQLRGEEWQSLSTGAFRDRAENLALGFRELALERYSQLVEALYRGEGEEAGVLRLE